MVNLEKLQSVDDREIPESDRVDQSGDESSQVGGTSRGNRNSGSEVGLTERLTDILVDDGDADLLLQRSDREDMVLQWLQALDMQVIGACRADERLKPLLKLNISSEASEDRLLAHLTQHFEPSEVGLLARCLCIPLVSIRVGKIEKKGTLVCPTATRGNLNLALLPTSDLRISFIGDDGHTERLSTLRNDSQCAAVVIEEIVADKSGRSFLMKIPDGHTTYFWCSEKSKLLGHELLRKMKDLLGKKPSLAELSGISESRLDCFATHLRSHLVGSSTTTTTISSTSSSHNNNPPLEIDNDDSPSSPLPSSSSRSQRPKPNPHNYQLKLSPKSSPFKEGGLTSREREKAKRRIDTQQLYSLSSPNHHPRERETASSPNQNPAEALFLESLGKTTDLPFFSPLIPISSADSLSLSLPPFNPPLSLAELPSLDFPPLLSIPTSKQIPTFTPLMCDPIVHVPMIAGPGYLVSAGPGNLTSIPSVEKGARETLRMLIGGSSHQSGSMEQQNINININVVGGSRGLYGGTMDVDSIGGRITTVDLNLLFPVDRLEKKPPIGGGSGESCSSGDLFSNDESGD